MSEIDWESGEITAPEGATSESTDWESGQIKPPVADKGFLGHAKDLGISAVKSAIAVPETAVGLGDIITGGKTGKAAERLGFRPKDAKSFVSEFHTDKYKEQQQDFQNADGVIDKLGVAVENPSLIGNAVTESIAPMLAGGVAGRAVKAVAPAASSVAAASIGEGAVMAGSQAEAIRQETDDGLLTPGQTLAAAGTGALGSVFGYAGGRLAAKLGIGDADTLLTRGITPEQVAADLAGAPAKSIPRKVIEGAITEGFLEELPQSVSEQIIQNLALDKPWSDGVDDAIVMGTLSGMAMGGAAASFGGPGQQPEADPLAGAAPQPGAIPPEAPAQEPAPQAAGPLPPLSPAAEILPTAAPAPVAPSQSQQMGIDPNAGPMSSAAALAVDSGASEQLAQQSALQQAAELAQKGGNASGNGSFDPDTGEVLQGESQPDRAAELKERIDYVQKQAKISGWDQRLMEERESAMAELAALQPQEKAVEAASQVLAAGGNEADASRAATDSLIGDMEKSPGISIASDAPAAVAAAVEKAKEPAPAVGAQDPRFGLEPPTSVQEGIKQAQAKAAAKATPVAGDIKAITNKQIPDMTDAELQLAADHYGPEHKRTAKLNKEIAKRGVATQNPQLEIQADAQQATETEQASPQRAQAPGAQPEPAEAKAGSETSVGGRAATDLDAAIANGTFTGPAGLTSLRENSARRVAELEAQAAGADAGAKKSADAALERERRNLANIEQDIAKYSQAPSASSAKADFSKLTSEGRAKVVADAAARWMRSTETERAGYVERINAKPVLKANLPRADFESLHSGLQRDIAEQMGLIPSAQAEAPAAESGNEDAITANHKKVVEQKRRLTPPTREQVAEAESIGLVDADKYRTIGALEDGMGMQRKRNSQSIEGKDIDGNWSEFSKESGTQGVPRAEMPQIKAEHRGAMVNFLNARGIEHQEDTVPSTALKPTQAEFSREKVAKAKDYQGGNRSILVSGDGHVLDGHHQWMAAREKGEDVKVIRLNAPIKDLLAAAREFPSSTVEAGAEPGAAEQETPERMYHVVGINEKTGAKVTLSAEPMTHKEATTFKSKQTQYDWRRDQLEEVSQADAKPASAPAPEAKTKDADRFAGNKIFTPDAVAAARARMKSKFGTLNSGIDPEMMIDGMTVAGAYIESGIRSFAEYAKAMVEDMGDGVKPYLLSFWEGARNYPGLDTKGMTSVEESAKQHAELLTPAVKEQAREAVGTVAAKPSARTKKTGAKGDMTLTQDWGVPHIDGYGDGEREIGNDTKDAFLKEARNYLNATADALRAFGYEPHLDRKGKPEKPVSVNESGPAGSGDVSMVMRNPDNDSAVYITIGGTSLRGMVPSTDSGISIMYRVGTGSDRYAAKAGNTWAPVDLSANELAALMNSRVRPALKEARDEQPANGNEDQGRAQAVRAGGRDSQPAPAQADSGIVEAGQPADVRAPDQATDAGRPGLRQPAADVAADGAVPGGRDVASGRAPGSRAGAPDAGAGNTGAAAGDRPRIPAESQPLASPAGQSIQAADFHIDNPLDVVGGTPVVRFNRNRAALELMQDLQSEGRQATAAEQKVLAGYIGWGSFGQELFQGSWDRPMYRDEGVWKERGQWLRETLGESGWKSAQRSITNAHYTDPPTVMAMWDMVRRMGFDGGKVLEPSMGTGNFYSMMPADLKARSQLTGIELDEATGAIAKQLFPKSNVRVMGYQESKTPDNFYDLVIGNWPFENTPVADRRYNKLNPMLHDYFFLKAMDQVRPGGIVIGITSAGSMDKKSTLIRRELAKQGELVASVRLPSGAFQEYAGTKVVTDIVILRKRPQRLESVPSEATWVDVGDFKTPSGETISVNRYYLDNPQNVIGVMDYGRNTSAQPGMTVHRPENMAERLKQAVSQAPENALLPRATTDHITYYANAGGERHGALFLSGNDLMIAMGDQMVKASDAAKYEIKDAKKTAAREAQLKALVDLGRKHLALVDAERADGDADAARKALNASYKAFVKEHGSLRGSFGLSYLSRINDPFHDPLAALENDDGKPAAVLTRSTTRSKRSLENPTVRDAYVLARNESVSPSIQRIADLSKKPEAEVRAELLDIGAVFELPNGDIAPSDIYLSGNVRQKLREAQAAADEGNKAMEANVAALQEVMPEDVPYFNIETKLGATWVPSDAYKSYIAHMLSRESIEGIDVSFQSGRWRVRLDSDLNRSAEASTNYGTGHVTFSRLAQAAMSNQTLRLTSRDADGNDVYDAEKSEEANARISKMREDFGAWLWGDLERRQDLEREYNEARNAWATPKYDGSFMTFEGMALTLGRGEFNLRQHQVNAIWRAIVNRRSINAHEVGTGKTFTMGGIAIESRRYGIAKKPVILAHNANSASVAAEIRMMYPSARVLYIDNLDAKNRAVRLHQIANDDWDAIVLPHSLIDRLALREETLMEMAADDIAALEAEFYDAAAEDGVNVDKVDLDDDKSIALVRSVTAKELAKARKRIIETIKKQGQQASKEGAVAFEDLGIDMILVDEAHEFKKPPIVTRMQMKGLNTQVSDRSIALQFLTRYVRRENSGGNVHTFTGTPITNTITEIYHQMKYVMESEMDAAGVSDWDGWFGSFATEVQDVELTPAGDYEMVTRLAGFVNVPELRQMIGQYMDTVFADDMPEMQPRKINGKELTSADLTEKERAELLNGRTEGAQDRPYKKVINVSAEMTAEQQRIFRVLQGYAKDWRDASKKQRKEWMADGDPRSPIVTEGIANKASFDARLLDDSLAGMEGKTQDEPDSKASRVVSNVLEIYNSHEKAGQVIFADMGMNKSVKRTRRVGDEKQKYTVRVLSTMHDIVERLVQGGIPREQIALVGASTDKEKRREIAEAMNTGAIRVVLGSTDTLGVGVNMQRNLRAMHHLDAPYMPGELEQRNGRGQRQGNQWNTVLEYRYMTDRLDGRRWQILAVKQRFITAFMKASGGTRTIEGEAAADEQSDILESFSEAAGDPRVLQRVKIQKKIDGFQRKERLYAQGIADMRRTERRATERAEQLASAIEREEKAGTQQKIAALLESQRENFRATIDGQEYDNRAEATDALNAFIDENVRQGEKPITVGKYGDQPLSVVMSGWTSHATTIIKVHDQVFEGKGFAGAEARMRNFPKTVQEAIDERDTALSTAENMRKSMKQPFSQAADLERAQKQLDDLEKDLAVNPVPPPAWLRQGAPIDAEVFKGKQAFVVTGHRYSDEGWFVVAEDAKGTILIPYLEAVDGSGMAIYEAREFVAPDVIAKGDDALTDADKVPDAPKFSFAGRNAQGADLMALATAKERIAAGWGAESVRKDTGWSRGADGKWRFEISDDQARLAVKGDTAQAVLNNARLNAVEDGRSGVVASDVLDHPQLFAAYPELASVPITVTPVGVTAQARLIYAKGKPTIMVKGTMPAARLSSSLLHELQHAIQRKEGYATGGSKDSLVSDLDPTGVNTYRRLAGEVEARNTQMRQRMTPAMRRDIAPQESADTAADQVIITFNGKDMTDLAAPKNASRPALSEKALVRAFNLQFPKLSPAVSKMLARGKKGEKGGVVILSDADPLAIAGAFSRKTGRPLSESVQMFGDAGKVNGFYDPRSGLTFLVGPNLDPVTGPAVLLHEMTHGQQKQKIDQRAADMLMNRGKVKNADLRTFLDRVASRMIDAGETANAQEAAAYIVEQAVIEGRSQGYALADSRFLGWVDSTIGKQVGDFLRSVLANIRQFMLRNGMPVGEVTVDDLVQYAMAGVEQAATGDVQSSADLSFSRSGVRDLASKATAEFNRTFSAPGKLSAWHKTVGTMYNLAERSPEFKPVFQHAQGFIDDVAHYAADASEHAPTLLPRLETWKDITKSAIKAEDNKAIAKPIFEGTLLWARDESGKAVLVDTLANAASMLSTERKAEILLAQGKVPEGILKAWRGTGEARFKQMIDSRYETHMLKPGVIWSDAELTSLFNLTAPQIAMYREFREATDRSLDTMTRAQMIRLAGKDAKEIREAVMDAADAREGAKIIRNHLGQLASLNPDRETQLLAMAQSVQQALEQMQKVQGEGYAPLMRFGKFTVYVQRPSGESVYFGMFETAREANAMAASMRELYPNDIVTQGTKGEDMFKMFAGVNPETAELFGKFMDLDSTGDEARDKAFQEWLRITKNNRSAMKRLIHRKGISGYNEDVGRVLASFVYSNSRNTSAGLNMGDLSEAVASIPKEQGELQDVAVALAEYIKNPQEEAQAIRGLLFAQYLGGSVASAFVNMTQPFAVTFPWLSQYGGAGKAAKAIGLAAKNMSTRGYKYEADLAEALKKAEDDGIVSPQEVHQLMAQARGSGSLRAGDGTKIGDARALASNSVARMSVAWGKLFGSAEQVNRRITYIAAYRMAKAQGMASPDEFARHAVTETQFVYSKASKMKWGRGAVGGTLMTFKTYSIAYVELMSRLWNQGEPGTQERADGRKAAALMIATLLLMSGAGGLPFAEDAEDLIDGAGQLMGYNLSSKKIKEQFLIDVFGDTLGGFVDKGLTGIPGSPVDVSGRLGMGNLIPGTGLFLDRADSSRDIMELAGPAGDFAKRIFTGGKELLKGNVGKAVLEVSPTAVRNAAKGIDMAATGMYRDTKGYKVLDATLLESALKGIGFQPGGVAKIQEANYINQRSKAFYSQQAQNIRAQWAAGIFEGDPSKVQAARDALAAWNAKNPEQRIIIRIPDVMRRVREMSLSKDERIAKTAPKAMRAQMMEDAARIRGQLAD